MKYTISIPWHFYFLLSTLFIDTVLMFFLLSFSVSLSPSLPLLLCLLSHSSTFPSNTFSCSGFLQGLNPFLTTHTSLHRLTRARVTAYVYHSSPYPIHPSFAKNRGNQMQSVHKPKSLNLGEVSPLK